jgi:hypothetical protein
MVQQALALGAQQVARYAYLAGFRKGDLVTATAIALASSGGVADRVTGEGAAKRVGLWQIRAALVSDHKKWTVEWLKNPTHSAEAAWEVSDRGKRWGSWPAFTNGRYKKHLTAAKKAADAVTDNPPKPGGGGAGSSGPPAPKEEPFDPKVRLGRVFIHGSKLGAELASSVTIAGLSWSINEVTQLAMTIADPGFELYRTGLFEKNVAILYREPATAAFPAFNLQFRIASLVLDGGPAGTGGMQVLARSQVAWKLKKRRGPKVMKKVSPTEFVAAECKKVGAKFVGQPSAKRGQVARDVAGKGQEEQQGSAKPSSWTTFQRLASELGYVCFEWADTVYFGKPSWLIARDKDPIDVAVPQEGAPAVWTPRNMPTITMSEDAELPVEISEIELETNRLREAHPGGGLRLRGLPPLNDDYLITSLSLPLVGVGPLLLSASTPKNPPKQPPSKGGGRAGGGKGHDEDNEGPKGGGGGSPGGKSGAAFVAMAVTASNARYSYGAEASSSDPTPSALDCSELVEWALGRIGVPFVDGSAAQYAACKKITVAEAMRTRGALLYKIGHIGISMGNGQSVEARNPGDGVGIFRAADIVWTGGGLVPGLSYR